MNEDSLFARVSEYARKKAYFREFEAAAKARVSQQPKIDIEPAEFNVVVIFAIIGALAVLGVMIWLAVRCIKAFKKKIRERKKNKGAVIITQEMLESGSVYINFKKPEDWPTIKHD